MRISIVNAVLLVLFLLSSCNSSKKNIFPSGIEPEGNEQLVKGFVYDDNNFNKEFDRNEKGISSVAVSNGRDIVLTDKKGFYSIPVADDDIVFLIKPRGWMTSVNEDNIPQFHYIYKPNGSPDDFIYKGVDPTGVIPEEVNFPLYEYDDSRQFKVLVFGDTQPYSVEQVDYLAEDIINELIDKRDYVFGMTMGDIVGDDLDLFAPLNQAIRQIGLPWYYVMGNHDVNYSAPTEKLSDETFEKIYGPTTYAFTYGQVNFIVLDDIIHKEEAGSRSYIGGLRDDQILFVENFLKLVPANELVVLTMHIPFTQGGNSFRLEDQNRLFSLLENFTHTLSISAHTHVQQNIFFEKESSGWQGEKAHHHYNVGTTSGSWWNGMKDETNIPHTMMRDGTPNGYAVITFKGTDYIIDWKVAGAPTGHRMNIHIPRGIVAGSDDNPLMTVNFFNGSDKAEVLYRVKDLTVWEKMKKNEIIDPYYALLDQRWTNLMKLRLFDQWMSDSTMINQPIPGTRLPRPQPSAHIWTAELGTDWPVGRHIIEVRVRDMYGRVFTAHHTMRITGAEAME